MRCNQTLTILFWHRKSKADKNGYAPVICRITVDGQDEEFSTTKKVTSGIYEPQELNIDPLNDSTDYSLSLLDLITDMKLTFGYSNFFYSNANYNLLAEIIIQATKLSYRDYINSVIIKPSKLYNTYVVTLPVENRFKGYIPFIYLKKYSTSAKVSLIDASDFNLTYAIGAADITSSTSEPIAPVNLVLVTNPAHFFHQLDPKNCRPAL